ncbi:MAG: exodeoxyribonuclease VII large subunit [Ilumatobacteraceae bacterium]
MTDDALFSDHTEVFDAPTLGPADAPTFSISELVDEINETLESTFDEGIWVWGEISGLSEKNRHTYFTLVEQEEGGGGKRAQLNVNLWAGDMVKIRPVLKKAGMELANGIKVRIYGTLNFYGPFGKLSLIMRGIDPRFTLGEIALQRDELVRRLKESGDYDRNRELELSPVPLRLGVVTSGSSAAWADFRNQIESSGYGFHLELADVVVQGEQAVEAVTRAIDDLSRRTDLDVVVVIRGGGSKTDLSTFDAESIARAIAGSALPVFTGIGHEIDLSVADEVAFEHHKTPTACAVALIERVASYVESMETLWSSIGRVATKRIDLALTDVIRLTREIGIHTRSAVDRASERLQDRRARLVIWAPKIVNDRKLDLDRIETSVRLLDPKNVLARGWSITRDASGRIVRSIDAIRPDSELRTSVADGTIVSTVTSTEPN